MVSVWDVVGELIGRIEVARGPELVGVGEVGGIAIHAPDVGDHHGALGYEVAVVPVVLHKLVRQFARGPKPRSVRSDEPRCTSAASLSNMSSEWTFHRRTRQRDTHR